MSAKGLIFLEFLEKKNSLLRDSKDRFPFYIQDLNFMSAEGLILEFFEYTTEPEG